VAELEAALEAGKKSGVSQRTFEEAFDAGMVKAENAKR
jgi:hypothetical protein